MSDTHLILLPTDGSPTADAAARFAESIARAEDGEVLVLSVAERAIVGGIEDQQITATLVEFQQDLAEREAAGIRATGVPATPLVVTADSPHEAILRVAEEQHVSIIVMGTHGRSALARAMLGSVADRVVRHASVPVVLVPLVAETR